MIKTIIKRNGKEEAFEPVKLRAWTSYGAEGSVKDIDWPTIMLTAANRAPERISSQDLQRLLIEVTLEGKTWSHYKMAGRLYANWISKKIHGDTVPTIRQIHDQLIGLDRMVEMGYTASEYAELEAVIDHGRDREYPHFSIEYLVKKYAISDHVKNLRYETPQFIYMRMAMAIAAELPNRVERAKSIYISFKDGLLSAPTPNYINFGTPLKGFASCCIYDSGDTAKSINAGNNIAYTMTYMSAGIGKVLNTRSVGDSVRNGSIKHQGKLPYIKATKELVSSNLQNSRGGAATITWNIFDSEAFTLLALQNPMTPEAKRIRGIDYSAAYTPLLLRYAIQKKNMFHFNVRTAPDLYHAMYSSDKNLFGEIYAKYEADNSFHKDYFSAREVLINLLMEAEGTGRYYYTNVAEVNHHTPHLDPIRGSNLCQEIQLPIESYEEERDLWSEGPVGEVELELYIKDKGNRTLELPYVMPVRKDSDNFDSPVYLLKKGDQVRLELANDDLIEGLVIEDVKVVKKEAEVAMCNLAAIAPSRVLTDASRGYFTPEEIKEYTRICYDALLMIDVAIHSADYPLAHIGYTAKNRLNAGVGLMGVATYLARSGLEYTSQAGKDALHRLAELHSFCCITASLQLSRELGVAPWMHRTKWVNGWLPVDTYNRNVDGITEQPLLMDWESLRSEIIANGGIRNSTVVAMMPGESSSKALGLPNSIYPVRDTLLIKTDFGIVSRFAAESQDNPDYKYQSAWDIPMKDQSDMYAIVQKFTDQGISADSWRKLGEGELLPSSKLLEDFFYFTKVGNKARYYTNTMISTMKQLENGDMEVIETLTQDTDAGSADCAGGACKV